MADEEEIPQPDFEELQKLAFEDEMSKALESIDLTTSEILAFCANCFWQCKADDDAEASAYLAVHFLSHPACREHELKEFGTNG